MKNTGLLLIIIAFLMPDIIEGQDHAYINRTLQDFAAKMQVSGTGMISQRAQVLSTTIEGSEFLNDEFEEGEIFTTDNVRFTGIPMRFNAYRSEIEVLMPDNKIYYLTKNDNIIKILLDSSVLYYTHFISEDGERSGYLALVYNSKSILYRRDYKIFKEGAPSNGIINEIPARFMNGPEEYYVKTDPGLPRFFRTSKDLTELLGIPTSEIKSFLKKEKINVKKEADLIKVLTYFDSLN